LGEGLERREDPIPHSPFAPAAEISLRATSESLRQHQPIGVLALPVREKLVREAFGDLFEGVSHVRILHGRKDLEVASVIQPVLTRGA
jgi:hypothetical protein